MIIRSNFSLRPFTLVKHAGFQYLTVIQNGLQIGALAQTPEGRYVQVNGAFVQCLNTQKVERALKAAQMHRARYAKPAHDTKPASVAPVHTMPVVTVRQRRRVAVLLDANTCPALQPG
jgi:hypothetical protein